MNEYELYTVEDCIYMTGSRMTVIRNVYECNGLYYITWYGNKIQIERDSFGIGWRTVEDY